MTVTTAIVDILQKHIPSSLEFTIEQDPFDDVISVQFTHNKKTSKILISSRELESMTNSPDELMQYVLNKLEASIDEFKEISNESGSET